MQQMFYFKSKYKKHVNRINSLKTTISISWLISNEYMTYNNHITH